MLPLKRVLPLLIFCFNAPLVASGANDPVAKFRADVTVLAADDMEGRGLGTKGLDRAASYIERRLRALRLEPAFVSGYRQPFQIKTGVALSDGNRIDGVADGDWTPLGFSSAGAFSGELAFVGYGIDAPAIGYREYEGVDLRGKVALMLRYEPQERDEASPFAGRNPSRWSAVRYRVLQARERGAVAVIFATGPLQDEEKDKIPPLKNDGPESPAGIPVLQVKTSVAQKWLDSSRVNLLTFQKDVDRDLAARSIDATGIKVRGNVALRANYVSAQNVAGILPGKGALANDVVVIGAHYDHLGFGGERSMRPNENAIHNGADDNASGTAAVLLAAEQMRDSLANVNNHRTIVFALFSGEEVGLAGSSSFVAKPPRPMANTVAMINLDMVGRLRDNELAALGADSAPEWSGALQTLSADLGLKIVARGDGYGPSDQTSFYAAQIPVLHFFTGTHEAYHTPDDDVAGINAEGGAKIAALTARLGTEIARGALTPRYTRLAAAPAMEGDSRGYGAYLGTVPDYKSMEAASGGVLLSDVRPGGPADLAGIRGGDRLIEIGGTKIENLYDMTFALQDHKPGETVNVVVIRNGEKVTLRATLGDRSDRGRAPTPSSPSASPHSAPATPPAQPNEPQQPAKVAAFKLPDFYACRPGRSFAVNAGKPFEKTFDGEKHLKDVRQLTFGGENAEAYFSPDGKRLIYQATISEGGCDQQFILDLATGETAHVSSGKGRTTCGYFDFPESDRIVFASTEAAGEACPPPPDRSQGYVWAIYDSFDLYESRLDGQFRRLTETPGYDAEATWCHRGGKLVFTSMRDGDLDLYEMNEAGDIRRLTSTPGYDGGAFYSPDCSEIVWRASRPDGDALVDYKQLLGKGLIRPTALEIFVMKSDGTNVRQVTSNGAANFCPYFHPDGNRIIFSSNVNTTGREFDVWMVPKTGGEPERITFAPGFDGFPQFSPDGEWIVWASNRANPEARHTNLFIARWIE